MNRTSKIARIVAPALVALAGIAFTGTASAHNISKEIAHAKCREYVRGVINDPRTPFTRADISSVRAFSGHNHYIRCTAKYDTPQTASTKRYACQETLDVYLLPEKADTNATLFMRHITRQCGRTVLRGPNPR